MKILLQIINLKFVPDITKQFNQYSNIVICIYADNPIGKNLALGNDESVSIQEKEILVGNV